MQEDTSQDKNTNSGTASQQPVFETIPIEEEPIQASASSQIEDTPEYLTQEELEPSALTPDSGLEEPFEENNLKKYVMIGGGAIIVIIIFVFIIRFILGLVSGEQKVTLTYWGLWEDKKVFEPLIAEYEKNNPKIKIKYELLSIKDYHDKLVVRSKEGNGPDMFRFHNTWLFSIREITAELPKKVMSNEEFEKTFYKIAQNDLKIGNSYYGIPLEIDGLVLVYNDTLLKDSGFSGPPKTWSEVIDYASAIKVQDPHGNILTSAIALGTANNIEHFSDIFGLILLQNGGSIDNLSSQEAQDALQFYRSFAEPPNNFWDREMPNNIDAFIQGKVGMIIVPSWQVLNIKTANPDLKVKVTTIPILPGGNMLSVANYWVEGVSKGSKHQSEAWNFLYFLSKKENMTKLYEQQRKSRLFGEPYSRVDLKDILITDENIGAVLDQSDAYKSIPVITRTYDNALNDGIIKYIEDAINATEGGLSYDQALQKASQGVLDVFKKYNIDK